MIGNIFGGKLTRQLICNHSVTPLKKQLKTCDRVRFADSTLARNTFLLFDELILSFRDQEVLQKVCKALFS